MAIVLNAGPEDILTLSLDIILHHDEDEKPKHLNVLMEGGNLPTPEDPGTPPTDPAWGQIHPTGLVT